MCISHEDCVNNKTYFFLFFPTLIFIHIYSHITHIYTRLKKIKNINLQNDIITFSTNPQL